MGQAFKFGAGLQKPIVMGLLMAVWVVLVPSALSAHIVAPQMGGVASGFEHPQMGPDHLLAMFAKGLWGAQIGGSQVWRLAVTFPMIMVVGGVLAILGLPLPTIEVGIALSLITLGAAIGVAWHLPSWVALTLIAFVAICHGYAHRAKLPRGASATDLFWKTPGRTGV